ncbi:chaplin [Streptomyces sp. XY511]|uniref:chaplin n=1 Tax=Streptomyces sp. XY511 TaxID=1519480 RepID=UPI0006AE58C4|nr:chaplin [Streptomyces sp. XY511]
MKRINRTVGLTCALAVAGALLAGCGPTDGTKDGRGTVAGMDMQGAAERADAMFYATVGAIKPDIEWVLGLLNPAFGNTCVNA